MRSQTAMFYLRSPQHNKSVKFDYQKVYNFNNLKTNLILQEIEMKRNYKKPNQARKFDSPLEYERLPHEENYN